MNKKLRNLHTNNRFLSFLGDVMKKYLVHITGFLTGLINGLFGAGGGIIAVPLLKKSGLEQKHAHATSIAVTLPLSILSVCLYVSSSKTDLMKAISFMPGGVLGAIAGAFIIRKISPSLLKRIFGGVVIFAAIRGLMR